jgi:hypothetical protein
MTLIIDKELYQRAKGALELIEIGLRNLVKQRNREALRKELGTFDLELTLVELEQLRAAQ